MSFTSARPGFAKHDGLQSSPRLP